jgi:SAM-dependent methyltransferase
VSLRFHEIAESRNRILNPVSEHHLALLGEVIGLSAGQRLLDLCCGKGEMLCGWALRHGVQGVGVDISEVFLAAARARAAELGVTDRVSFVRGDAAHHAAEPASFDVVSCLGATWIGDGLAGTIELMRPALRDGGLLLVGEPYWISPPPREVLDAFGFPEDVFTSLPGTLDRVTAAGCELVEMVLADGGSWDRYAAPQWWALDEWLRANPDDPDHDGVREFLTRSRRGHLLSREHLGWGVFVLRAA